MGDAARVEALWGKAVEQGMVGRVRALVDHGGDAVTILWSGFGEAALRVALGRGWAGVARVLLGVMQRERCRSGTGGGVCLRVAERRRLRTVALGVCRVRRCGGDGRAERAWSLEECRWH